MAKIERTWQKESLNAISIYAHDCKVDLKGTDGDQVELTGDFSEHRARDLKMDCSGQYLKIHAERSQFALKLPQAKSWFISIFSGHGEIDARDIQARMRIMMGSGDVRIENCRGMLAAGSGHGNLQLKHFIQVETRLSEFTASLRDRHQENNANSPWDWFYEKETDLEYWGQDLGEKIGWWAMDLSRFFDRSKVPEKDIGVNLQTGDGSIEMKDIQAKASILNLGRGNLKTEDTHIGNLVVNLASGNIECKSAVPTGDWKIKTARGNIELSLPSNIGVRLDMATRHGNIDSEIPLVRVARQGPESYSGMRMVGATGTVEGIVPQLQITTVQGNIKIESESPISKTAAKPAADNVPPLQHEINKTPEPMSPEGSDKSESAVKNGGEKPASVTKQPVYDTQLVILKALREGQISVSEADQLLRSLGP